MAKKRTNRKKKTTSGGGGPASSSPNAASEASSDAAASAAADSSSTDGASSPPTTELGREIHQMHIWQIQAVRDLLFVAAVIAIVGVGYALRAVTVPLLIALLLAYLFEPVIIRMCEHPKVSRVRAVTGLLCAVGVSVLIIFVIMAPLVVGQTSRLVSDIADGTMRLRLDRAVAILPQDAEESIGALLDQVMPHNDSSSPDAGSESPESAGGDDATGDAESATETAGEASTPLPADDIENPAVEQALSDQSERIDELQAALDALIAARDSSDAEISASPRALLNVASESARTLFSILASIVGIGLMTFLIPFYFFFFSLWYPDVLKFMGNLIPEKNKERTLELLRKMDYVVAGFVRGRIVISLIMGVMLAIGWLICGVPYSIPLGIVIGAFCAVPYLGVIGIPLAIGLLFFDELALPQSERMAWYFIILWPTLVFGIVQTVEGYVLTPMIAGKATNLDPVTILVAVLAGGSVLGVYGMLLAIPLAACGKIMLIEVLLPKINQWTRGEARDPLPFGD